MSESHYSNILNGQFPSADAIVVADLAALIAMGRLTLDRAAQNLREMGYAEKTSVTAVPAAGESREHNRVLSGVPQGYLNDWVRDVQQPCGTADSALRGRVGAATGPAEEQHRKPVEAVSTKPSLVLATTSDGVGAQRTRELLSPLKEVSDSSLGKYSSPTSSPQLLSPQQRSRSAAVGARTVPQRLQFSVQASAPSVSSSGELILYLTTVTSDRIVRDAVRSFERLLFLLSIPYHPCDVSENRFLRRKIVEQCGGEDKGLPLLFVGDRYAATYIEAQEMVDCDRFIPHLLSLGAELPARVIQDHRARVATGGKNVVPPASPIAMSSGKGSARPALSSTGARQPSSHSTTVSGGNYEERLRRWRNML